MDNAGDRRKDCGVAGDLRPQSEIWANLVMLGPMPSVGAVRIVARNAALQLFWAVAARRLHARAGSGYKAADPAQRSELSWPTRAMPAVGLGKGPYERPQTTDAEGNRRVARRKHLAGLRADRRVVRPARAGGEGHRRRRRGPGHQGHGPDLDRPAHARGNRARRGGPRLRPPSWPRRRSTSPTSRARRGRATRRCRAARTGRTPSYGSCAVIPSSRTARS